MQDIVDLLLNVGYRVYVAHDRHLESLLPTMDDDGEHKPVVKVQAPLIKKRGGV